MKIIYRTGNLFESEGVKHIAHCCNAQGRMGSGFAKELRKRFPEAYDVYAAVHAEQGLNVGSVVPALCRDGITIFNIIGQRNFGHDGARYVSYDGLTDAFSLIQETANQYGLEELHMPLLGCDLAGGKWSIVSAIIEAEFTTIQPVVHLLEGVDIGKFG